MTRWNRFARVRTGRAALAVVVLAIAASGALLTTSGCRERAAEAAGGPKVIVLGFDGMDFGLTKKLMAEGRLPNFSRLAAMGSFQALGTAIPPQSPVAWSNFITGMDAGGHGIFDFIHRDPKTMLPYLSTSRTEASERNLKLGKWQIPLSGGKVELLRHGEAFWEALEKHGIHTTVMRIPANFPPSGTATEELSGMGTPDLLGSYGTFSFYTTDPLAFLGKDVSGGKVYPVDERDDVLEAELHGMPNPFRVDGAETTVPFTLTVDPVEPAAKLEVDGHEAVLKVGEWSEWIPVSFHLVPTQSVHAIARFYLKSVRPELQLYVTPLNLDPEKPALPISTPKDFAAEIADATGRFYTQGMPEDTKAYTEGVFDTDEFIAQATMAGKEVEREYRWMLNRFHNGLLFYYFGNSDQMSHMLWRPMDPGHPAYDPVKDAPYADVIPEVYERFDKVVGYTLDHMDSDTVLVVMSDHGFTTWRRAFNLNAWLRDNGYLGVRDPFMRKDPGMFANVKWSRTRAYALGLNGLYINVRGREKDGIVDPSQRKALMDELVSKLEQVVDPTTGERAILKVYERDDYRFAGERKVGPDLIVGYNRGYRSSNESALGEVPRELFEDNTSQWSGDHCMDPSVVPGILFSSRPLGLESPRLDTLAAGILALYDIHGFPPETPVADKGSTAE